jgi:hypothetical protein
MKNQRQPPDLGRPPGLAGFAPLEPPASKRSAAAPNKGAGTVQIPPWGKSSPTIQTRSTIDGMTTPTKNVYWMLVDEHTDIIPVMNNARIDTVTYEANAAGGKLVRTVTRIRDALVESMMFVPTPPTA